MQAAPAHLSGPWWPSPASPSAKGSWHLLQQTASLLVWNVSAEAVMTIVDWAWLQSESRRGLVLLSWDAPVGGLLGETGIRSVARSARPAGGWKMLWPCSQKNGLSGTGGGPGWRRGLGHSRVGPCPTEAGVSTAMTLTGSALEVRRARAEVLAMARGGCGVPPPTRPPGRLRRVGRARRGRGSCGS